jgi:hypothetical protein
MKNRYAIYSNDDHMNPQERLELYADRFKAERVFIPNAGHFGTTSGVKEIPEIFNIVEKVLANDKAKASDESLTIKKDKSAREDAFELISMKNFQ